MSAHLADDRWRPSDEDDDVLQEGDAHQLEVIVPRSPGPEKVIEGTKLLPERK